MARPRKMGTEEMLAIINAAYERHGDPSRLKCSSLAEYATTQGFDVKGYDFRRNPAVRARIEELIDMAPFFSEGGALAYKSLDVDAFINRNRSDGSLKNALIELDSTWRKIHDRACALVKERESLSNDLKQKTLEIERLECEFSEMSAQSAKIKNEQRDMIVKNRYLTGMIKKYLYPAVANEILKKENVVECVDTEVMQSAMDELVDRDMPAPFSKSVTIDRQALSREEMLLRQMGLNIRGDENA